MQEVDALKKQIDDMRPLSPEVEGRVMQKLRLDWNYHSNAIEGNKLNYGETVAFLMEGITAKGKPLKDHLDIRGHNEAINFLLSIVKDTRPISEADIRALHKMILVEPYDVKAQTADGLPTTKRIALGEYKTLPNHVQTATGETHYYATPEETPAKMQELMEWYTKVNANTDVHPVVAAALFHHKFVSIHPFDDGNGRLSRILINLILMQADYPPVVIKMDDRTNYYSLLSRADNGDEWAFVEYMVEVLIYSLNLYLKAANGDDINEEDDIDKRISLFKLSLSKETNVKDKRSKTNVNEILLLDIKPLFEAIVNKAFRYSELFFKTSYTVKFISRFGTHLDFLDLDDFAKSTTNSKKDEILAQLDEVAIVIDFEKFKNSENDFSFGIWLSIKFSEYYYQILELNDEVLVEKLYHEQISPDEQKLIIEGFIDNIENIITNEL